MHVLIINFSLDGLPHEDYLKVADELAPAFAEVSGLSKGAIYHHYDSKKDLFLALIDFWEEYFFFKVLNQK